jgi:hypothetical protein
MVELYRERKLKYSEKDFPSANFSTTDIIRHDLTRDSVRIEAGHKELQPLHGLSGD